MLNSIWTEKEPHTFDKLKLNHAKKPVVIIFDTRKEITLTTNTSEHSIAGIASLPHCLISIVLLRKRSNFHRQMIARQGFDQTYLGDPVSKKKTYF